MANWSTMAMAMSLPHQCTVQSKATQLTSEAKHIGHGQVNCKVRNFTERASGHTTHTHNTRSLHYSSPDPLQNKRQKHSITTIVLTWNYYTAKKHNPMLLTIVFGRHKAGDSWQIQAEYPYQNYFQWSSLGVCCGLAKSDLAASVQGYNRLIAVVWSKVAWPPYST